MNELEWQKKIEDIKIPHEGRGRPRKEKAFDPNDENSQFLNGLNQNQKFGLDKNNKYFITNVSLHLTLN